MATRRIFGGLVLGTVVALLASEALAIPPWKSLIPFRRVEADANKEYRLTEANGPWLIMATSFAGENASAEAHALVLELRKRYKMEAFVHHQHYDFTKTVMGKGLNRYGDQEKRRYAQARKFDEVAVLVGNYQSVDDPNLQKALKSLKAAKPDSLELQAGQSTSRRYARLREQMKVIAGRSQGESGSMAFSFVTRNPLIPQEFFTAKGLDPFVIKMNKDVEHSLLKCPGVYTVRIATFRGRVEIDQQKISEIQRGGKFPSRLEQAAVDAHRVVEVLRARGVEAYEFHDRYESIVTIGSFNSVGDPRADGKTEINPAVHRIMKSYGPQQTPLAGGALTGMQPRKIDGVMLDVQPIPVRVPKKSVGSAYARARDGLFR